MPSRFAFFTELEKIQNEYGTSETSIEYYPYYNLKPTNRATGMIYDSEDNVYKIVRLRWEFIKGQQFYKARAEGIHEKRMFGKAFRERRCLIFANGFFEWEKQGSKRIPHYFQMKNAELMTFAGVYNTYIDDEDGNRRYQFAIITVEANNLVKTIFHRMPAIIPRDKVDMWIKEDISLDERLNLLQPLPAKLMKSHEVNSLPAKGDNGPATIKPKIKERGLDDFF